MLVIILLVLVIRSILSRDICYSVNNVCETDVKNAQSIHYSGYDFVGDTRHLVHPDTPVYNDVKHFLKENICHEGTLFTGLSKNKSIAIFGPREDKYTYYGKDGSIIGATQSQTVYLQERVMIHQPTKGIPFQLNYGSTRIFPDITLVQVWWAHFYSLIKAHSEIQLVSVLVPDPSSIQGQTQYTLACAGTILVIADPRCTFTTELEVDPAETDYDDQVTGTRTTVFGGAEPRNCIRRVPMLFSGSVRVTTYHKLNELSQICTPSTYICGIGQPAVRQIHIIKSSDPIQIPTIHESTFIQTDQIPFACNCKEEDLDQGLFNVNDSCAFTQTMGQIKFDQVVQSERHTLRQLCNADITCDNDALESHSTRECGCKKTSTNLIPQYQNNHGILKDPYGFSVTTPCKSWIPHQAKDTSVLLPPFKRIHACDENLPSLRGKRSIHPEFCLPLIVTVCFGQGNGAEGAVTKAVLQNVTDSLETSIRSLADKAKEIQNNLNSATHVFNRYSLRINQIEQNIQFIIKNLNSFITSTNRNFDITQMEIETLRIQTTIDKLNFKHLYLFLKALHSDRLAKVKEGFIIDNNTGCVSVPDHYKIKHFRTIEGLFTNQTLSSLPEIIPQTFTFTLAPHIDLTKLKDPTKKGGLNTAVVIAIVVCIIVVALVIFVCICKFL